jgi:hypothetical protein
MSCSELFCLNRAASIMLYAQLQQHSANLDTCTTLCRRNYCNCSAAEVAEAMTIQLFCC